MKCMKKINNEVKFFGVIEKGTINIVLFYSPMSGCRWQGFCIDTEYKNISLVHPEINMIDWNFGYDPFSNYIASIDKDSLLFYYTRTLHSPNREGVKEGLEEQDESYLLEKIISKCSATEVKFSESNTVCNIERTVASYGGKDIDRLLSYMGLDISILNGRYSEELLDGVKYLKLKLEGLASIYNHGVLQEEIEVRKQIALDYHETGVKLGDTSAKMAKKILSHNKVNIAKERKVCDYKYFLRLDEEGNEYYKEVDAIEYVWECINREYKETKYENMCEDIKKICNFYKESLNNFVDQDGKDTELDDEVRNMLRMPLYDGNGRPTNTYVSFSKGGIHGAQFDPNFLREEKPDNWGILKDIPYISEGTYIHSDFTSYYPNVLINMGFFGVENSKPVGGVIEDLLQKKSNTSGLKRSAVKLILNALTGEIANTYKSTDDRFRRPITALNMRIIGQFITWYVCQCLASNGCEVVSVNTDGFYWKGKNSDHEKEQMDKINKIAKEFNQNLDHDQNLRMISRNFDERIILDGEGKIKASGDRIKNHTRSIYEKVPNKNIYIQKLLGELLKNRLVSGDIELPNNADSIFKCELSFEKNNKPDVLERLREFQIIIDSENTRHRYFIIGKLDAQENNDLNPSSILSADLVKRESMNDDKLQWICSEMDKNQECLICIDEPFDQLAKEKVMYIYNAISMKSYMNLALKSYRGDWDNKSRRSYQELKFNKEVSKQILNSQDENLLGDKRRYYIEKCKPFYVSGMCYYELIITMATDGNNKSSNKIVYAKEKISTNYAVKMSTISKPINLLGREQIVDIVIEWEYSIRPCEIIKLSEILKIEISDYAPTGKEYMNLMGYLRHSGTNLLEIILLEEEKYKSVKTAMLHNVKVGNLVNILDAARTVILEKKPGANTLRYMLYHTRHRIIKSQKSAGFIENNWTELQLKQSTQGFDLMPLCTHPVGGGININTLFKCQEFETEDKNMQLFVNKLESLVEIYGVYIPKSTILYECSSLIDSEDKLNSYVERFNEILEDNVGFNLENFKTKITQRERRTIHDNGECLYISSYAKYQKEIIEIIREKQKANNTTIDVKSAKDDWLKNNQSVSNSNIELLSRLYRVGDIAIIKGAAGTGKSTLAKTVYDILKGTIESSEVCFLATTHTALQNLREKAEGVKEQCFTVASFTAQKGDNFKGYKAVFIDECSMISDVEMANILKKAKDKMVFMMGDPHQVEAIQFGNWFSIIDEFVDEGVILNLTEIHRTSDGKLHKVWGLCRECNDDLSEKLKEFNISHDMSDDIFQSKDEDEVLLCLNYAGIYGINAINSYMQAKNHNKSVSWGINLYKIGDPILFNGECKGDFFKGIIHNGMKGRILHVSDQGDTITFTIQLEEEVILADKGVKNAHMQISRCDIYEGQDVIKFTIKQISDEISDGDTEIEIPFDLAYTISIHRAQGLEYNSVKLVISEGSESNITHDIFYTAITRAKKKLNIYWEESSELEVLKNLKHKLYSKDIEVLREEYR